MATLDSLKYAVRQKAVEMPSFSRRPLTEKQYIAGFDILMRGSEWMSYREFIIPQLCRLFATLTNSHARISLLEIGPGPKSVLGSLPRYLRRKIARYVAFEPNQSFSTGMDEWFSSAAEIESPFPRLECPPEIHRMPFILRGNRRSDMSTSETYNGEKFDIILFCHSMYGMKPKAKFIEQAIEMLKEEPEGGMVVVFHRDGTFRVDGLVCHRTASFPTGAVCVTDDDGELDQFASFITGFLSANVEAGRGLQAEWRKICRTLGSRKEAHPGQLFFSSPIIMAAFTKDARSLSELFMQVPLLKGDQVVKNREARLRHPASILRPTDVRQVQLCVQWALKHRLSLSIVGGGPQRALPMVQRRWS